MLNAYERLLNKRYSTYKLLYLPVISVTAVLCHCPIRATPSKTYIIFPRCAIILAAVILVNRTCC